MNHQLPMTNYAVMVQKRSFLFRWQNLIVALFVCYAFVLFVPANDVGYYFEFRYGLDRIVNKTTWNVLLVLVLFVSAAKVFVGRVSIIEAILLLTGLCLIIINLTLSITGSHANFNYLGFLLLTSVAIFGVSDEVLVKAVALSLILVSLGTLLTISDNFLGLEMSPIVATRYTSLAAVSDGLRLANSSLFGQNNAAGAAIAFGLLFILLHIKKQKSVFYLTVYVIGFMALLSTRSMGAIIVSIAGLILYLVTAKKYARSTSLIIFLIAFIIVIFCAFDLLPFLQYKWASGSIKCERAIAFFDAAFSNPTMLILGENIGRATDTVGFHTESSFLDVWLNFGMFGAFLLVFIIAIGIAQAVKARNRFAMFVILLLFVLILTQNSSLMPANVILLLVVYRKLWRRKVAVRSPNVGGPVVSLS